MRWLPRRDRISPSDKAKLMSGTLTRIYGWSPQR
jgi:hypothetical protein